MPVGFNQFNAYNQAVQRPVQPVNAQPVQITAPSGKTEKPKLNKALMIGGSIALILATAFGGFRLIKKLVRQPKKIVNKSYERIKHHPELISHADEMKALQIRITDKFHRKHFDIDYYKDLFRAHTIIVAEKLKVVREATDPKLRAIFDSDRNMFWIHDGIMIHGSDRPEKKELLNYFIEEARKHDFDIVHIPVGDVESTEFGQSIARLFPEAKQKFLNERKQTMFVIENVDGMLQKADDTHRGGLGRGQWNVHTHQCGSQGITTLTTAKDISTLDDSSIRGGRITEKINIDKAVELSKDSADKM